MKCDECGKHVEDKSMDEVYAWLKDINDRHPPFDMTNYIPLSVRYRHLPIKTLWRTDLEDILKMPTTDQLIGEGKLKEEEGKFILIGLSPSPV